MDDEKEAFQLILHSGDARMLVSEALELAKKKQIHEAELKLKEAKSELLIAQKKHAEMLRRMANQETVEVTLLLVHAEDHVVSSEMALNNAIEIVALYQYIEERLHHEQ